MRLACFTMVYNEPVFLPLWVRYGKRRTMKWSQNAIDKGHSFQWRLDPQALEADYLDVSAATVARDLSDDFTFRRDLALCPFDGPRKQTFFDGAIAVIPERYRNSIPGAGTP